MSDSNHTNSNKSIDSSSVTEHHAHVDWTDNDPVSIVVIGAVAAVSGSERSALDPLYECLDPDALNALFAPQSDNMPRRDGFVSFSFNETDVTVHSRGEIVVRQPKKEAAKG